ncbi:MAG: FkbM family methyltransferase [Chthoniobacter sp.]
MTDGLYQDTENLWWLRRIAKLLPIHHRYYPLVQSLAVPGKFLLVPSLGFKVAIPSAGLKPCMDLFLGGLQAAVPDFFLVQNVLADLTNGVVLDVGANLGCWSLLCSRVSALPIVAFEPEPTLFDILTRNIQTNAARNVDLRNVACGAEDTSVAFHRAVSGGNGFTLLSDPGSPLPPDPEVIDVKCCKLDTLFVDQDVAFIKIDVEGFEWHVLRGAADIIARRKPVLFVEIHPPQLLDRGKSAAEVYSLLKSSYPHVALYLPRQRAKNKLANFFNSYRSAHQAISEEYFFDALQSPNPPPQIYALCRA